MDRISLQDIFDAAWENIIVQEKPPGVVKKSDISNGLCEYKTADGKRCAIGYSLPDGHPAQSSGEAFSGIVLNFPELWDEDVKNTCAGILNDWQEELHDDLVNTETGEWKINLHSRERKYREFAKRNDLSIPN